MRSHTKYLTFELAGEEYAIPILKVREVVGRMDITPVPGGVGPMTIAMLLVNTLELARRAHG